MLLSPLYQTYQAQLLAYQRRVDPDQVSSLPKDFVDHRTEDLTTQPVVTNNFEGEEYQNGIRVVAGKEMSLSCVHTRFHNVCTNI